MNERFAVETMQDPFWPSELLVLRDYEAKSWARLYPSPGCNLNSFGAEIAGREVETFLQPADETPSQAAGHYGAPVLFPFPNRLRGGRATFRGKTMQFDLGPGQANAIHGAVRAEQWKVERADADSEGAVVRCSVEATSERLLRQFPFPYRLSLEFRLVGRILRVTVEAENLGNDAMPMGFGWHPYFRLPLVPGSDRGATTLRVPARQIWELDDTLVPTGETVAPSAERDFRTPKSLGGLYLDDVYTDVEKIGGQSTCEVQNPETQTTLRVSAGPSFREWVVYAPPSRPTLCFEPYTCPTDAFNLSEQGIDAGVIVLQPGGRWSDWIELEVAGTV